MTIINDILDISEVDVSARANKIFIQIDPVLKSYVPQFLKALNLDIIRIAGYLNGEEFEEIRAIAHRLKGEGGTYGFDEAGKLGALIQTAAINRNAVEIDHLVNRLSNYLKQIEIVE
ncbi:MAG TPA: Hpt domain-containing protein [Candidatus Deferrimicrobium sp.]|nr:Hpt domain-containing protein [Candidatus Deferrimicrobium sp.]